MSDKDQSAPLRTEMLVMKADSPKRFFNRELSWLFFNSRVLEEARNSNVPLLERVRFLSISVSNLDEFYLVRVAGLRTQVLGGMSQPSFDGYTPVRQLEKIAKRVRKITKAQGQCWRALHERLLENNIRVRKVADLTPKERESLAQHYKNSVLPLLTHRLRLIPLILSPSSKTLALAWR